jgi:hypothetical protein
MTTTTVKIRMYRQGLGDCFLLTFPRPHGPDFYVMIDCGVVMGGDPSQVVAAANDIFTTTQGHLNLVVGTHIHWDHISGFCQAKSIFDQFTIDNIWLPWTEDKSTQAGLQITANRTAQVNALRMALTHMDSAGLTDTKESIQSVLDFMGPDPGSSDGLAAAGGACTSDAAMNYLRTRSGANVHYCTPTTDPIHTLDGVPGVQIYVLGPPTNPSFLGKVNPSVSHPETYNQTAMAANEEAATDSFLAAVSEDYDPCYAPFKELTYPFDLFYRIPVDEAKAESFFCDHYGFTKDDPDPWRRIDSDWLNVTSELALNLDNAVNNTSLVLAFELGDPGSGKVLLFAADAQVGNWLSWGTLSWTVNPPGQPPMTITSKDLLSRVVFFKVGHHGSHNATLAAQGLDLMTDSRLVSMISVNHDQAVKKRWPGMPFLPMLQVLTNHTRGRVLRIDNPPPPRVKPSLNISDVDWQAFISSLDENSKYLEFAII